MKFLMIIQLLFIVAAYGSVTDECRLPRCADVFFLVDGSRSLGELNFRNELVFVSNVIDNFHADVRSGIQVFSDLHPDGSKTFQLPLKKRTSTVPDAIDTTTLDYAGGQTYMVPALESAEEKLKQEGRKNCSWHLLVITDGIANDKLKSAIKSVRELGIATYAVGFGKKNRQQLLEIAGNNESRVFTPGGGIIRIKQKGFAEKVESMMDLYKPCACSLSCQNGGTLISSSCSCDCADFYTGDMCETCSLSCQNGGTLISSSCSCDCADLYTGDMCEIPPEAPPPPPCCKPILVAPCTSCKPSESSIQAYGACYVHAAVMADLGTCSSDDKGFYWEVNWGEGEVDEGRQEVIRSFLPTRHTYNPETCKQGQGEATVTVTYCHHEPPSQDSKCCDSFTTSVQLTAYAD